MNNVFVLKDPVYHEAESKIHNFTLEWLKWYRFAKIAPKNYQFKSDDIIVVNINDGDPYKGYTINPKCKQVHIIHKINKKNISYLKKANAIIYMNDVIKQISHLIGVDIPYVTCPRYPLYDFFDTKVVTEPFMHIGGWFFDERINGLKEALIQADNNIPHGIGFGYYMVTGGLKSRRKKIDEFVMSLKENDMFNHRANIYPSEEQPIIMSQFIARTARYALIHRNTPTVETVLDLINDKDLSVLQYDISESSMLSLYQSAGVEVIAGNNIDLLPLYKKTEWFTFSDFSHLFSNILKIIS